MILSLLRLKLRVTFHCFFCIFSLVNVNLVHLETSGTLLIMRALLETMFLYCQSTFLGLPISEIEYPAITVCSQGWISSVTQKAMNYQFKTYAESKGHDLSNMTEKEIEGLKADLLAG